MKRILKFYESFGSTDTFKDVQTTDLVYLTLEQIIALVLNTFESEIINDNPKKTVIKSKWKVLEKENEMTSKMLSDIIDDEFEVYFHIYPQDYIIVRGEPTKLNEFLTKVQSIDKSIKQSGGTEGKSVILKGKNFYNILYSLPSDVDDHDYDDLGEYDWNNDWDYLRSMGCGGDLRLEGKTIAYYSDLLIGTQMEMETSLAKRHPGLSKTDAIMKDIEERSKPTLEPKISRSKIGDGIFKGTPNWNDYKDHVVDFKYEKNLFEICGKIEKSNGDNPIYLFKTPKYFEKMKFNMHEYSPADVYYALRIYEINNEVEESESFVVQWIGKLFANPEHLQNYYKKYPHFGPGGSNHTFIGSDGKEHLSYQPPMFKDITSMTNYHGDSIGGWYYCKDRDAFFIFLEQFTDFVNDNTQSHFETDYPNYKGVII